LQCVAVCCSVLQCVAVCCSALQCVAVRCSALQCVAVCCSALQCVAVCFSVLQCVAVCCSVLCCVDLLFACSKRGATVRWSPDTDMILFLRAVIQPLAETTGLYRGFFLLYHEPYEPQRINTVGVSFETTPMGTITYTHSSRTGVDSSGHTQGSES